MRVIYDKPRGQRIKKGSCKILHNGKLEKINNFRGLTHWARLNEHVLDWDVINEKWIDICKEDCTITSSCNDEIKNLKQAIRHIKKHDEIHKGTRMILESRFKGFDIVIIK